MSKGPVALEPIQTKSIAEQVTRSLRTAILDNTLPPGSPITESKVAKTLEVSKTTVRSAMATLESQGLLVRKSRRFVVTDLDKKTLGDRVAVRSNLESIAFERFGERYRTGGKVLQKQLKLGLDQRLDQIKAATREEVGAADFEFHDYVWSNSEDEHLCQLLRRETAPLFAGVRLLTYAGLVPRHQVRTHQQLSDALLENDKVRMREFLEQHLHMTYDRFFKSDHQTFSDVWRHLKRVRSTKR